MRLEPRYYAQISILRTSAATLLLSTRQHRRTIRFWNALCHQRRKVWSYSRSAKPLGAASAIIRGNRLLAKDFGSRFYFGRRSASERRRNWLNGRRARSPILFRRNL